MHISLGFTRLQWSQKNRVKHLSPSTCRKPLLSLSSWFPTWHVHFQQFRSGNLYLLPDWDPRVGTCSHLGLHPHLPHISHCHPGELYHFVFYKNRAFSAWTHVLLSFHVGSLWPGIVSLLSPYHAKDILVQCSRNFPWCLYHSRVFHSWILSYGVISTSHHVFWSLYCHLQSFEIHLHPV